MNGQLEELVREAVSALSKGGIVAFPTETVYGIAADFRNESAIRKVFHAKKRERNKPLTLLLPELEELPRYVHRLPKTADKLTKTFWPGPLTLIFKASGTVPEYLLGPGSTIGTRMTSNETAMAFVKGFGNPLATTSANISGSQPLRSAAQVTSSLGERIDYVLPGFCGSAPPSAVLNLSRFPPKLERSGAISPLVLARTMQRKVRLGDGVFFRILIVCTGNACRSPMAEGMLREMTPEPLRRKLIVASAGTAPLEGSPPTTSAIKAARELGADISGLVSRQLNREMISSADLILTMEQAHRDKVAELVPEAWQKTHLLKGYGQTGVPTFEREIRDPIGMPLGFYRKTAGIIQSNLKGVVAELTRWLLAG
ncbi:MAG: L-threonylcarbamoyladenylate synthase [bacterium]